MRVGQFFQDAREVGGGALVGDLDMPPALQRREQHEQIGHAAALVLAVLPGRLAHTDRQRRANIADQLLAAFVNAYHRPLWIVRPGVDLQHIFHVGYERRIRLRRDNPLPLEPRLDLVFLSVRQTVAGSIDSTTFISTSRSDSSVIVQWTRPAGACEQATAINCASCLPSSLRY